MISSINTDPLSNAVLVVASGPFTYSIKASFKISIGFVPIGGISFLVAHNPSSIFEIHFVLLLVERYLYYQQPVYAFVLLHPSY